MTVKNLFEYTPGKFFVLVNNSEFLNFVDRATKQVDSSLENPTGSKIYLGMKPIPGFDSEKLPIVLVRDKVSVMAVNLVNKQILKVIGDCPSKVDILRNF
jgi:hypothetical protein